MKVPLGFSLIFHLMIILIFGIRGFMQANRSSIGRRVYLKKLAPERKNAIKGFAMICIQLIIVLIIGLIALYGISYAIDDKDSMGSLYRNYRYSSLSYDPVPITPEGRYIIVRIDDVQATGWSDISMRMINDAISQDIRLSLAIIPHGIRNNHELIVFLKKHQEMLEFTIHGWGEGYADYEFAQIGYDDARILLDKGIREMRHISKDRPVTFVPPNNIYSADAYRALIDSGFTIISGRGGFFFDYDAKTYDFEKGVFLQNDATIEDCRQALDENGVCVVMIHPQDYADGGRLDPGKYAAYLDLLDGLSMLDADFVTFKDFSIAYAEHEGFILNTPGYS